MIVRQVIMIFIATLLMNYAASGQDQHYSQFYASPTLLNPALAGAYDGKFRVSTLYRDQWRSSLEVPIKSFIAALDLRFDLTGDLLAGDAFAVGIQFKSDQAGPFDLSTNAIFGTGAYHKALDRNANQVISAGIQFSAAQRNILYENIVFQDQFDGLNAFSLATNEDLPENNFSFGDLAVGLNYFHRVSSTLNFYGGGAMHHILSPEVSFYSKDSNPNQQSVSSSKLERRYSLHGGASIQTLSAIALSPRLYASLQGQHLEFMLGNMFVFKPNPKASTNLHVGGWLRFEKSFDDTITPDALSLQAAFNIDNLLIGMSYDIGLSHLVNYAGTQGVFELSISYFGDYEAANNLCPSF